MMLTAITYGIGDAGLGGTPVMLTVLAITFAKTQMIAAYFMGLRKSGLLWRAIMGVYLATVATMIAVAYLMTVK